MSTSYVVRFTEPEAASHELAGGKGANLGALTHGGFPVPPGFTVTTASYAQFLATGGLGSRIAELVGSLDYGDADALESVTATIRAAIVEGPMPDAIAAQITEAYAELGEAKYVAVRSSGTAEDLADASFAGMHDTYLDIVGPDNVIDAVKRCWASLWTARATSYRNTRGFGHDNGIAIVVQTMVPSEISGVMFTANPLTAATDEIVINASWGLGEAIVSGIATPDEYVVYEPELRVRERTLGAKEKRVVRNPDTGVGTVVEDIPEPDRERFTMDDAQVAELCRLGRRVQQHYGDFPQDTEWGYAEGRFYLLQSRPVTGVELSWDADVDAWQWLPQVSDDTVWTRNWSDEVWTGAITPLFYSIRSHTFAFANEYNQRVWGTGLEEARIFRYHRGSAYYNCALDRKLLEETAFPSTRPGMLANTPPVWHEEIVQAPFSLLGYLKMQARMQVLDRYTGLLTWREANNGYILHSIEKANGLTNEQMALLSDAELMRHVDEIHQLENEYVRDVWSGFFVHARDSIAAVATMFAKWYDGGEIQFNQLITGTPRPTATMVENRELWHLAEEIRNSELLSKVFAENENEAFFQACGDSEEGRGFLKAYDAFMADNGHRGHADRDIYYTRRSEDPGVDYRSLRAFLSVKVSEDPEVKEQAVEANRKRIVDEVVENIKRKPLGTLRADLFRVVLDYAMKFIMFRDDERHWVDRTTFTMKRGLAEIGRRLVARGVLENERDFYFLTKQELYDVLNGRGNMPLLRAKIAGRARNFDRVYAKESRNPKYLRGSRDVDFEYDRVVGEELPAGMFRGVGTSGGVVEGTARIVHDLKDIGRVQDREILITASTDPGWTPVFMLLSGILLESGGMLAHGSCLAREYGMPAVQLSGATRLIPDGARIRINGDTGAVEILDDATGEDAAVPVATAA